VHRELLTYSLEGRRVDLLTITGKNKSANQYDSFIDHPIMHPEIKDLPNGHRAVAFNKPVVFLSARVHPGEVPSSHVLNGLMNFLTDENDVQSKALRDNFLFKIIPCLNPDAVY
jgi:murein tripeptide amidase MpaA